MGRFYKTAKPEFINDFIYQPPWELMQEALSQRQQSYDATLAKADLGNNINMDYIDDEVERQKVQEIQNSIAQKAKDFTQRLYDSGDNWERIIPEIENFKREIEANYKTGDISKIQKSAASFKAMEEHLKTIKDPTIKEAARNHFLEKWRENPNRSLDKTFESNEIYDKQDIMGKFLEDLKLRKPEISEKIQESRKGGYINFGTLTTEVLDGLKEDYFNFIKANNYEPYLRQQENFGLGKYFDAQNKLLNIDDTSSSLYSQGEYAKGFEYKHENLDISKQVDQYEVIKAQEASTKRIKDYEYTLAKSNENTPKTITFNKDASFYYNYTKEGKEVVQKYRAGIAKLANDAGVTDPAKYDEYINNIRNNPKEYPNTIREIQKLDVMFNSTQTAGTEYFKNLGLNQEQVNLIDTKFKQKGIEKTLYNKTGYIDFGTNDNSTTQYYSGESKRTLNSLKGKSLNTLPGYEGKEISDIEIVEGTTTFMPAADVNSKSGVATTVKITPNEGTPFYAQYYISGDPLNIGF